MFERQVAQAIRQVSESIIMPRYRQLEDDEIFEKGPGDLVTVADRESELALAAALLEIDPTSLFVGEEAVAATPVTIELAREAGRVWIVDPIDGTGAFARGKPRFAVMVALLQDGATTTSWIWQPVDQRMYVGALGGETTVNGLSVTPVVGSGRARTLAEMSGIVRTTYFDEDQRKKVDRRVESLERVRLNRGGAVRLHLPRTALR